MASLFKVTRMDNKAVELINLDHVLWVEGKPAVDAESAFPGSPAIPARGAIPGRPSRPAIPGRPAVPATKTSPEIPAVSDMPAVPEVPDTPAMPAIPAQDPRPAVEAAAESAILHFVGDHRVPLHVREPISAFGVKL